MTYPEIIPVNKTAEMVQPPQKPIIYLVVPCYNEEAVLPETNKRLCEKLYNLMVEEKISKKSKIVYVNDGSRDKTWELIEKYHNENNFISGVKLSCNKGHQNALMAGLSVAKTRCDAAISLDADLQDDINAIDKFIDKFKEGCDVVYGVRDKRETDSFFKRTSAQGFYKVMKILGVNVVYNHADYRLMSARALEALESFEEVNMFLRGVVPLIGFKSDCVYYQRSERFAGESKYPLKKMLSFAIEGITSFSIKPIRMVTWIGFFLFIISLIMLVYTFVVNLIGSTEPGWTSIVASIWMIGGIQLLCLGVVGEYVGKIYNEVKKRPKFIIETFLSED